MMERRKLSKGTDFSFKIRIISFKISSHVYYHLSYYSWLKFMVFPGGFMMGQFMMSQ